MVDNVAGKGPSARQHEEYEPVGPAGTEAVARYVVNRVLAITLVIPPQGQFTQRGAIGVGSPHSALQRAISQSQVEVDYQRRGFGHGSLLLS
jgi:hypothetical protein